ncbi:hypothetical protein V8B97DRAFT_1933155 [Scleroderma yunnanense]
MKPFILLFPLVGGTFAASLNAYYKPGNGQRVLNGPSDEIILNGQTFDASPAAMNGFSLDLAEKRLIQMEGKDPIWMTELEKIEAKANGIRFFDITDNPTLDGFASVQGTPTYPTPRAYEQVTSVIKTLTTDGPRKLLEKFTSYWTRYYRSETGAESQKWLLSQIEEITAEAAHPQLRGLISIDEFPHSWGQNTIIARINGSSLTDDRIVIIAAHLDSTNMWPFSPAPGADDDGSGTVTILESYRALLAAGFKPKRPVEFHWYSAEEGGLLGSQAVAKSYAARELKVYAMSQYDMTAWVKAGVREEIGVITDYVNPTLTEVNKQLIDAYLDVPYVETECGYACSDHASWAKAGYPSIFTIESAFKHANLANIHSARDRIDISEEFSFDHMLEFSKLAVAFAIELAGWDKL